jgi:hypothetical protein
VQEAVDLEVDHLQVEKVFQAAELLQAGALPPSDTGVPAGLPGAAGRSLPAPGGPPTGVPAGPPRIPSRAPHPPPKPCLRSGMQATE